MNSILDKKLRGQSFPCDFSNISVCKLNNFYLQVHSFCKFCKFQITDVGRFRMWGGGGGGGGGGGRGGYKKFQAGT